MIIATIVFGDAVFDRMANVLAYSVAKHCPKAKFLRIDAPPHIHVRGIPDHCPANHHKKKYWADVVDEYRDDEIVLLDCDTVVLGDLAEVFERDFDLAYTIRPCKVPLNAGVMFLRSTQATRRFFDKWLYFQELMISDEERPHLQGRLQRYAGLDQAALVHTVRSVDFPIKLIELPCSKYNSVDQTWNEFSGETLILHLKGQLRRAALACLKPPEKFPRFDKALRAWLDLEAESKAAAVA